MNLSNIYKILVLGVLLLGVFCVDSHSVLAQSTDSSAYDPSKYSAFNLLDTGSQAAQYQIIAKDVDPRAMFLWYISRIISFVLNFLAIAFLCLVIYGGYLWMTASGNSDQVETGRGVIFNATIGLLIIVFANVIVAWFTFFIDEPGIGQ